MGETAPRRAIAEDLDPDPPALITTKYRGKDGAPLQFLAVELSIEALEAARVHILAGGAPNDPAAQRIYVQACVVDPPLDDARIRQMQKRGIAWADLLDQISVVNGVAGSARNADDRTFRAGDERPEPVPGGGAGDLPLLAGAGPQDDGAAPQARDAGSGAGALVGIPPGPGEEGAARSPRKVRR